MKTKRFLTVLLVICLSVSLMAVTVSAAATASGTCGSKLTWKLSGSTLTISGTGVMTSYEDYEETPWYKYADDIESIVISDGVTSVGDSAFMMLTEVTSVTLPDTMRIIGESAFAGCSITEIELPKKLTYIGNDAFSHTYLTTITIPDNVANLGRFAFGYCEELTTVNLSKNITRIGEETFNGCTKLKNIELHEGITYIGAYAFNWCEALTEITLPSTLTELGNYAFQNSGVKEVVVPGSVKTLGPAFWGSEVEKVTISDGVEKIQTTAFGSCSNLTEVIIPRQRQGDRRECI